jgi:hypothetical protein
MPSVCQQFSNLRRCCANTTPALVHYCGSTFAERCSFARAVQALCQSCGSTALTLWKHCASPCNYCVASTASALSLCQYCGSTFPTTIYLEAIYLNTQRGTRTIRDRPCTSQASEVNQLIGWTLTRASLIPPPFAQTRSRT